jgi:hypothetical protein
VIKILMCPLDPRAGTTITDPTFGVESFTSYPSTSSRDVNATGDDAYDGVIVGVTWNNGRSVYTPPAPVTIVGITDGTSNTIMVGERPPSSTIGWGWWAWGSMDTTMPVQRNVAGLAISGCPVPAVFKAGSLSNDCSFNAPGASTPAAGTSCSPTGTSPS